MLSLTLMRENTQDEEEISPNRLGLAKENMNAVFDDNERKYSETR